VGVSFDFLGFQQFERCEGFEEDGPGREDCVGGEGGEMSEEAGSLCGGLASVAWKEARQYSSKDIAEAGYDNSRNFSSSIAVR
jgi:hypothetical protein